MLTVTEKAARYLRESLARKEEEAPEAIRIVHTDNGYQLTLDDAKEGDQMFEQEGQNYLLVDAEVGDALGDDATLDLQETRQGARLTLLNARSPQPEPEAEAEPVAEAQPVAEPKTKTEAKTKTEPKTKTEAEPQTEA